MSDKSTIMVVDDSPFFLEKTSELLRERGYDVVSCTDSKIAIEKFKSGGIDIVLTDIVMPETSGLELLTEIRDIDPSKPVILMTGKADLAMAVQAISKGAFDFVVKSDDDESFVGAVRKAEAHKRLVDKDADYKSELEQTVQKTARQLDDSLVMVQGLTEDLALRLTRMAEYRDSVTGNHIIRVGHYAAKMAETLGMGREFIDKLAFASPMHDIGKVGIADDILLKKGSLTNEEFETMKKHASMGYEILSGSKHPSLQMAAEIAHTHHERWDGKGYPNGLAGEEIPIEGRITVICDVYDALRGERPYKHGISHEEAVRTMVGGNERQPPGFFDPKLLKTFSEIAPTFEAIFKSLAG